MDVHEDGTGPTPTGLWVPVLAVLVGLVCVGGPVYGLVAWRSKPVAPPARDAGPGAGPASSFVAGRSGPPASGPRASDYPARTAEDLGRVCQGWYYPQSPPFAGAAPHPVVASLKQRRDSDFRFHPATLDVPYDLPQRLQAAWQPADAGSAQLVACVDLVDTGRPLGECRFDDPQPTTVPMVEGVHRVRLHEAATGRVVAEVRLSGARSCPHVILLGADRTIYSEVTGRQLWEALRRYVET